MLALWINDKVPLMIDVETSIFQNGNPFSERNKLCVVGLFDGVDSSIFDIEYGVAPYGRKLGEIQERINNSDCLVGCNFKFDLHWCRRYGLEITNKVYDTQLVEFILSNQQEAYPSLVGMEEKYYGQAKKIKTIATKYWDKGIDTPQIPWEELKEYLLQDLKSTWDVYIAQQMIIPESKRTLINLHNQDLLVLEEMEYNGERFDFRHLDKCRDESRKVLKQLEDKIAGYTEGFEGFNADSPEHVSALLYGGTITRKVSTEYLHTYKSGPKMGTTEPRFKWSPMSRTFPRILAPKEGSEFKKQGFWSTDESTLRSLKSTANSKKLIDLLLERADVSKLLDTYYEGIPKLHEKMDWPSEYIHGTLNQCVAITGRLTSTRPNKQNFDSRLMEAIMSRYD